MSKSDKHYEVGYGRPPASSQFKAGQSGNPKGRPKGAKNLSTLLREELDRKVTVTLDGRPRQLTKARVAVIQQVDKAAKGDSKAFTVLMKLDGTNEGPGAVKGADHRESEIPLSAYDSIVAHHLAELSGGGS